MQVVTVASEYNCGEAANQLVFAVVNSYSGGSSNGVRSSPVTVSGQSFQGPASLDMRIFIDKVLSPVSAEIARLL